jgi:serine/threonine-protein kinase haspin
MLGCFVTEGYYPATLLSLWDEYDNEKGSENDRPDENLLLAEQRFVVMLLDNGGGDLEKAELSTAAKAVAIFNQVVHSLAGTQ